MASGANQEVEKAPHDRSGLCRQGPISGGRSAGAELDVLALLDAASSEVADVFNSQLTPIAQDRGTGLFCMSSLVIRAGLCRQPPATRSRWQAVPTHGSHASRG